jgi:hypothetical protein
MKASYSVSRFDEKTGLSVGFTFEFDSREMGLLSSSAGDFESLLEKVKTKVFDEAGELLSSLHPISFDVADVSN